LSRCYTTLAYLLSYSAINLKVSLHIGTIKVHETL
jgi:hypothetical protein